jgi:anti-sigma28 factor (negative regulator of flagellin synthesis)
MIVNNQNISQHLYDYKKEIQKDVSKVEKEKSELNSVEKKEEPFVIQNETRLEKIVRIKEEIKNGTYQKVDLKEISKKVVEELF